MYDFYFGTDDEIMKDEEKYLLSIKRMLPKWCNSIPDSEYIALYRIGNEYCKNGHHNPVIVETGCGASSIVLAFLALKYGGVAYCWDTNGEKGSILRRIMVETLCNYHDENINYCWKFIPYDSTSYHLGIRIIEEMEGWIDISFHDSKHTLVNLLNEVRRVSHLLKDGGIIAIDDGNYTNLTEDYAYINIFRKKLELPPVEEPEDNKSKEPFHKKIEGHLKENWEKVEHIDDYYKHNYKDDIFFDYYSSETKIRSDMKMEKIDNLEHRFDAWVVSSRK